MSDNRDTPQSGDHPGGSSVVAGSVDTVQLDIDSARDPSGSRGVVGGAQDESHEDVHASTAGGVGDVGDVGEDVDHTTEPDLSLEYQQQQESREAGMAVMDAMEAMDDLEGMGGMEDAMDEGMDLDFGSGGIDQATLANLAALSRIGGGDDDEDDAGDGEIDLSAFLNAEMGDGGAAEDGDEGQAVQEEQPPAADEEPEQPVERAVEETPTVTTEQPATPRDAQVVSETPRREEETQEQVAGRAAAEGIKEATAGGVTVRATPTTEQPEGAKSADQGQGNRAPASSLAPAMPVPGAMPAQPVRDLSAVRVAPTNAPAGPSLSAAAPTLRPQIAETDIDPSLRPPSQPAPRRDSAAAAAAEEADRSEVQAQLRRFFATNPDAIGAGRRGDGLEGNGGLDTGSTVSPAGQHGQLRSVDRGGDDGSGGDDHEHGEDDSDDADFAGPRYVYENGRLKRKRNRTVL